MGKASKNNPDIKTKVKEPKIYDSIHCEKCKDKDICKEYKEYNEKLKTTKIGKGIVCKSGK